MLEAIPHVLIVLSYFLFVVPLTIFVVTKNEDRLSNFLNNPASILHIVIFSILVFLLSKYLSLAFSFLFLHVFGFFFSWYYLYRKRMHEHTLKKENKEKIHNRRLW